MKQTMPELQLRQTSPYKAFGLSCPRGGTFYICADSTTQFIGCCTVDACVSSASSSTLDSIHQLNKRHINANEEEEGESSAIQKETRKDGGGKCLSGNLRLSSFSADTYDELPPQDCDDARGTSIWWTCKFNTPPFMSRCSTNPCLSGTCSDENLVPAKLSTDERKRNGFLSPSPSSSGTTTKLSSPTGGSATSSSNMDHVSSRRVEATGSRITGVAYTTTPLRPPTQSEVSAKSGGETLSNGAIGGIATGVVVVLVLVVVVLLCRRRWAAKRKGQTCASGGSNTLPPRDPKAGYDTVRNEGQFRDSHLSGTTAPVTSLYGDKPGSSQQIPSSSHSFFPVQEGSSVWRYSGSSAQTSPMLDGSQSPPPHQYHGFQHSQHNRCTSYLAPVSELSGEPMPQELANTAVTGV